MTAFEGESATMRGGRRVGRAGGRLDVLGAGLVTALALWGVVAAANRPGRPGSFLSSLSIVVVGYVAGRLLATRSAWVVPAGVAAGVAGTCVLWPGALTGGAAAPPFGYGNANGALAAQAVGAAALAACAVRGARARWWALPPGAALVGMTCVTRSAAAALGAVLVFATASAAGLVRRRGPVVLAAGALVFAVAAGTVALGAAGRAPAGVRDAVAAGLSERRIELWSDGVELTGRYPVRGTGPGTFAANSAAAGADADTRSAHSVWLRQGAEQGVPGLVLLGAVVCWGFLRLWCSERPPGVVAVGAMTYAVFLVQASIDYVAEFPVVLAVGAVLLGVATAAPGRGARPGG